MSKPTNQTEMSTVEMLLELPCKNRRQFIVALQKKKKQHLPKRNDPKKTTYCNKKIKNKKKSVVDALLKVGSMDMRVHWVCRLRHHKKLFQRSAQDNNKDAGLSVLIQMGRMSQDRQEAG